MKALTQTQLDAFRRDGFLFPIPALTAEEVAAGVAAVNRLEADIGAPIAEGDVKWRSQAHVHSPWFNDLVRHPKILDVMEDVIGPDILVWTSTFFIKEPGSATYAAWHQDGAYFGLVPQASVCAWVALTDASREAGCMEQLSFNGRPHEYHHEPLGLKNSINRAGQTIMDEFDQSKPNAMALRAGEISLHHELAVHRSAPNMATHRRIGFGINYMAPSLKIDSGVRCRAMLVRGQDRYGHFDPVEPPKAERDTAALAAHQAVSEQYRANYRVQVERHVARHAKAAE